jgi:hypothetical protein
MPSPIPTGRLRQRNMLVNAFNRALREFWAACGLRLRLSAAARGVGERIFVAASTSSTRILQQSLTWLCLPRRRQPIRRIHLHLHRVRVQSGDRQAHTSRFREREPEATPIFFTLYHLTKTGHCWRRLLHPTTNNLLIPGTTLTTLTII